MMKLPRRKFLHLAAGAAALPAVSRIARAQAYPSRPVRLVVGFAAGGRSEALPDIPSLGDFVPGYEVVSWLGMGAPKNTPVEIVARLNREINFSLADPKLKLRIAD